MIITTRPGIVSSVLWKKNTKAANSKKKKNIFKYSIRLNVIGVTFNWHPLKNQNSLRNKYVAASQIAKAIADVSKTKHKIEKTVHIENKYTIYLVFTA